LSLNVFAYARAAGLKAQIAVTLLADHLVLFIQDGDLARVDLARAVFVAYCSFRSGS
jgi:hypothetical protein